MMHAVQTGDRFKSRQKLGLFGRLIRNVRNLILSILNKKERWP